VAAPFHKFEQRERGKIWKALQNLGVDVVLR
jgi:dihydrodipicolinate synthase